MTAFQPETWVVVFHEKVSAWWIHALAFGKYKHVSAFGYVPRTGVWLVYDMQRLGTQLFAIPDCPEVITALDRMYADCLMVRVRRGEPARKVCRLGFYCVPAIKHLIGHGGGALRPDGLLRSLKREGAEIIHGAAGE